MIYRHIYLPAFHLLFSRHASPLALACFCGGRRKGWSRNVRRDFSSMQRQTAKTEAWWRTCAAPRLGYKRSLKAVHYCSYLGHQDEVTFVEGISERRRKSEPFVFSWLFRIRGPISIWDGWTEEGREREVLNEEARVATSCQKIKRCCIQGTRWWTEDGERGLGRKDWMVEGTGLLGFLG